MTPILELQHLSVEFPTSRGAVHAVEDLSFALEAGETLAIVGDPALARALQHLRSLGSFRKVRAAARQAKSI